MAELDPSETWSADERRAHQWSALRDRLPWLRRNNPFYRRKWEAAGLGDIREVVVQDDGLRRLSFTAKSEMTADQAEHPPYGTNLSFPLDGYMRRHQTSGTTGRPLRILDTAESWDWWAECWQFVYRAAGVTSADRVFFSFSFGPFIGFWSAFAGAEKLGALCLSGGAQSTSERVAAILATEATVLVCTPTYALRLADVAREKGLDLSRGTLRVSIHAGEPGASIPATRERIERALGVRAVDHTGPTEVGAHGFSCSARDGVHVIEKHFIAEILDVASGDVRDEGEGELVLTNLGRWGAPAIRYRTGDRVRAVRERCSCGRTLLKLKGGIIGRVDDMITVRGVNVFPSAIEAIVRRFDEVEEFRVELLRVREMDELRCTIEPRPGITGDVAERVATAIHGGLGVRCAVAAVSPGTLPRFELKAKRFVKA